ASPAFFFFFFFFVCDFLRTELTLGIISDENKAALILWMNYINVLKSLDLTGVSDEATFTAIRWPSLPRE
ncbi:tail fiber assembly protein, partial [Salmonella enterica]|uniref:tail fiber assembly protein n=1 Tax=Salmonella enterica TaxID=28901 RepID=UPI000A187358